MAPSTLSSLLGALEVFRGALTTPSFAHLVILFGGWVLSPHRHSITQALVSCGLAPTLHWEAFHRFFSRPAFHPDTLGKLLFRALLSLVVRGPIVLAIDDVLCPRKGPHIFSLSLHFDPVRSTKKRRVLSYGTVWVTLSLVVRVPFSPRPWALPFLFRLFRSEHTCLKKGLPYRKKTLLARELLHLCLSWLPPQPIFLLLDSAYCTKMLLKELPEHVTVFGSMRRNVALYQGGKRKKELRLASIEEWANAPNVRWQKEERVLYRKKKWVEYKEQEAYWPYPMGERKLKVVVVRCPKGIPYRVFFCSNPSLEALEVLRVYAMRWSVEVIYRDMKQEFGFGQASSWSAWSVLTTTPCVGLWYSVLVLWYAKIGHQREEARPVCRPWYKTREGDSFADVLRAAQRVLEPVDWRKTHASLKAFPKLHPEKPSPLPVKLKRVA